MGSHGGRDGDPMGGTPGCPMGGPRAHWRAHGGPRAHWRAHASPVVARWGRGASIQLIN